LFLTSASVKVLISASLFLASSFACSALLAASSSALAFASSYYLYLGDDLRSSSSFFSTFYGVDGLTSIAFPCGAFFTAGIYSHHHKS
jgi:hypothetical protein